MDAGRFQPEISSFRLHLAAEGKAPKTIQTYTEVVTWFAAAYLLPRTSHARWEQVARQDVQQWVAGLLGRYSSAYASNQYRALP
jgi:integrase/recombinase XerD